MFCKKLESIISSENNRIHKNVWIVDDNKVIKRTDIAQHEYEMCEFLFNNSIMVPKPYGTLSIKETDYFVMQRIDGSFPNEIPKTLGQKAKKLWVDELEKVLNLGIYPGDGLFWKNAIFDGYRTVLVDFAEYRRIRKDLIEVYRQTILDWITERL